MNPVPCSRCGATFTPVPNDQGVINYVCPRHDAAKPAATPPKTKGGKPTAPKGTRLSKAEAAAVKPATAKPRP